MPEHAAITEDERTELLRLRAENAALRAEADRGGMAQRPQAARPVVRQRWRAIVASLCIVLACVLAPLSAVAV
jgi:hypothetical protein